MGQWGRSDYGRAHGGDLPGAFSFGATDFMLRRHWLSLRAIRKPIASGNRGNRGKPLPARLRIITYHDSKGASRISGYSFQSDRQAIAMKVAPPGDLQYATPLVIL